MKNLAWVGTSDARLITADDLSHAGVETNKEYMFPHRTAVEVSNEVAEAIMAHSDLYGPFEVTDVEEGETLDFEGIATPDAPEAPVKGSGEVLDAPQTGLDTPAAKPSRNAKS